MAELLPCPFCGAVAELHTRFDSFESIAYKKNEIPKNARLVCEKKVPKKAKYYLYRKLLYVPRCTTSSCIGRTQKVFETEQSAVDMWNTRTQQKEG